MVSGDGQTGTVRTTLSEPLVIRVSDNAGDPVAGVTATWSVQGAGSLSRASVITGANGRAEVSRTLGITVGPAGATASEREPDRPSPRLR